MNIIQTQVLCFPFKASIENKIVGIGTTILHHETAWLAHIIVHPEYRNRGIGKMITQALVDHSYSKGRKTIYLIATELGLPVYRRLGFESETEYTIFKSKGTREILPISEQIIAYNNMLQERNLAFRPPDFRAKTEFQF